MANDRKTSIRISIEKNVEKNLCKGSSYEVREKVKLVFQLFAKWFPLARWISAKGWVSQEGES